MSSHHMGVIGPDLAPPNSPPERLEPRPPDTGGKVPASRIFAATLKILCRPRKRVHLVQRISRRGNDTDDDRCRDRENAYAYRDCVIDP